MRAPRRLERRPGLLPHVPPKRVPRWGFGATLREARGFVGRVDTIFADYWAALNSFAIPPGWFEMQDEPAPSTKDQVFYALVALDGHGEVLAGENDVEEA